jgi:putative membrane protein
MIVSASHSYPIAPVTGGVFCALPMALLSARLFGAYLWLGTDSMWLFVAFFSVYYLVASQTVNRFPRLKRLFLSSQSAELAVQDAARSAFFAEALYRTRDANGILLFISVLEQRVWVLGDRGISQRIDQAAWQHIVDMVVRGIKKNRRCDAICEAISQIGSILEEHFPYKKDDTDELHNLIIR